MKIIEKFRSRDIPIYHLQHDSGFSCFEIQVYPRVKIAIANDCPYHKAKILAFKALDYWLENHLALLDPETAQHRLSVFLEYPCQVEKYTF